MDCAGNGISAGDAGHGIGDSEMEAASGCYASGDGSGSAHERDSGEGPKRDRTVMIILACAAFLVAKWKLKPSAVAEDVIVEANADAIPPQVRKETDL